MKRTILLFSTALVTYLTLSSNSFGPANSGNGNRTGSPGSVGTCGSATCHGAQSATTTGQFFTIVDVTQPSVPVSKYIGGHAYTVTIVGNGPNNNFGFQAVTLNSSNNQVGTVVATDGKTHAGPSPNTSLIEHNQPIGKVNNAYSVSYTWNAPAAGTGTVTFYGIINSVNNVPGNDAGDIPSLTFNKALQEQAASVASLSENIHITAYPNPVVSQVNLKVEGAELGLYTIKVMDATGRMMHTESMNVTTAKTNVSIPAGNWSAGLYFAQVEKDGAQRMIPIVKQ